MIVYILEQIALGIGAIVVWLAVFVLPFILAAFLS